MAHHQQRLSAGANQMAHTKWSTPNGAHRATAATHFHTPRCSGSMAFTKLPNCQQHHVEIFRHQKGTNPGAWSSRFWTTVFTSLIYIQLLNAQTAKSVFKPWRRKEGSKGTAPYVLILASDSGEQFHDPVSLYPRKNPRVHTEQETGWVSEDLWTFWRIENLLPLPAIEPEFLGCPTCSPDTIPTRLPLLHTTTKPYTWTLAHSCTFRTIPIRRNHKT